MAVYVGYNVLSAVLPHEYGAGAYIPTVEPINLFRMILSSTVMPFALFLVGRTLGDDARRARVVLWMMVALGGYSALVSILQFHAPGLVWPRYIVEDPNWVGRANGVPNQPSSTASRSSSGSLCRSSRVPGRRSSRDAPHRGCRRRRVVLRRLPDAHAHHLPGLRRRPHRRRRDRPRLPHGVRRRRRTGNGCRARELVDFTSSDRDAGGVGSTSEVLDRLNTAATTFWAFDEKPLFGWGLGRFISVNTLHHQQWTTSTPSTAVSGSPRTSTNSASCRIWASSVSCCGW